jgi:mRNA interferase HigB
MKLMNRKEMEQFKRKHAQSIKPLIIWESIVSQSFYKSFPELKKTFPSADYVSQYTVFNISGNKYRLITEIDYEFQLIDIKAIWTHAEYSQRINVEKINRGKL